MNVNFENISAGSKNIVADQIEKHFWLIKTP